MKKYRDKKESFLLTNQSTCFKIKMCKRFHKFVKRKAKHGNELKKGCLSKKCYRGGALVGEKSDGIFERGKNGKERKTC